MTLRKRLIALSMVAACAATAFAGAAFTDQSSIKVDGKVIDTLTEKNVIKGFEDGSFKPDTPVHPCPDGKDDVCTAYRIG